jgi:glycosyltransferase involved in cell wall biosynthesis
VPIIGAVKVLIVSFYFPPAGGVGVQRALKFAAQLPDLGIETHVLAPDDPRWLHRDEELQPPACVRVHRARYLGPRGRRPAEELRQVKGGRRLARRVQLFARRLIVPDENATWLLTAVPAAIKIVGQEQIDVVLTTSPPGSVHLVGAAVKRATGIPWVADLRDPLAAHPHRDVDRFVVRLKDRAQGVIARVVSQRADAIVAVSDAIAEEMRRLEPRGQIVSIANGCDFDDFAGLEHVQRHPFRFTHTGSFFGKRDPRPFLSALAQVDGVVARFVGDFRGVDREWAESLGLSDRIELIPYLSHRRALELQRDSEALLLLIPHAGGRGEGILSGKVFEYIAAERPILALVPTAGAAARLLTESGVGVVVDPDDVHAIKAAIVAMRDGEPAGLCGSLTPHWRGILSRRARVEELAALLRSLSKREWIGDDSASI